MSLFEETMHTIENEGVLTEEQKKLIANLEEKLGLADKALAKGMKKIESELKDDRPKMLREQGNLAADHAEYRASIIADIRKIQPSWAENAAAKAKSVISAADSVVTGGVSVAGTGIGSVVAPFARQTGNFLGRLGHAAGKAFSDGLKGQQ